MTTDSLKIDVLERENLLLRERLAYLEAILIPPGMRYDLLGLTAYEGRVLAALSRGEQMSKEQILAVAYSDRLDQDLPELKIVDVWVCKIRKKLKPLGIDVETIWGEGHAVSADSRRRLTDLLAQLTGGSVGRAA